MESSTIEIIRRVYDQVRDDRNMPYRERIAVTLALSAILEEIAECLDKPEPNSKL